MSKKLMMNNYSLNGLMPIIDGLICWIDKRDGCDGNKVVDRIGLNNFLLEPNVTSDFFDLGEHNLISENFFAFGKDFSIQLAISIKTISEYGVILSDSITMNNFKICNRNNDKIGFYSDGIGGIDDGLPINIGDKQIITINIKNGIVSIFNDVLLSSSIKPLNKINCRFRVGGRQDLNSCSFNLYSLKIYNRALSEVEIQQNYLYEQSIERGE